MTRKMFSQRYVIQNLVFVYWKGFCHFRYKEALRNLRLFDTIIKTYSSDNKMFKSSPDILHLTWCNHILYLLKEKIMACFWIYWKKHVETLLPRSLLVQHTVTVFENPLWLLTIDKDTCKWKCKGKWWRFLPLEHETFGL